jgi:hypothetical protein
MNYLTSGDSNHEPRHKAPTRTRTLSSSGLICMQQTPPKDKLANRPSTHGNDPSPASRKINENRPVVGMDPGVPTAGVLIEISPGVQARLRGSEETWQAILDGGYAPVHCLGCSTSLFAIQDCSFVLCPHCRVISPMDAADNKREAVGMGFTFDDLVKWHPAAESDRRRRDRRGDSSKSEREKKLDSDRWQSLDRSSKDLRCPQRNNSGELEALRIARTP